MVRKATELTSLDQLDLNPKMRYYIKRKDIPLDVLVKKARDYYHKVSPTKKWLTELTIALDDAGFIRHDFDQRSFMIGRLYRMVYINTNLNLSHVVYDYDNLETNELYENYIVLGNTEISEVLNSLNRALTHRENEIIKRRFGLCDDKLWSLEEVGIYLGVTRERVRQLEVAAFRRLLRKDALPHIFGEYKTAG